jgi:hypothetical protein
MSTNDLGFMNHDPEKVRRIFDGSDSRAAHELSRRDPNLYISFKQAAVYHPALRIVPESALSRQYRVKKEDLEAHAVAALAAEKNDKIMVPDALCDRLLLPKGSKVDYSILRTLMGKQPTQ